MTNKFSARLRFVVAEISKTIEDIVPVGGKLSISRKVNKIGHCLKKISKYIQVLWSVLREHVIARSLIICESHISLSI